MTGPQGRPRIPPLVMKALGSDEDGVRRDDDGNEIAVTTGDGVRELRYLPVRGRELLLHQHPPFEVRPADLPGHLPFVAGLEGTVGVVRGRPFGTWWPPGEGDADAWARRFAGRVPTDAPPWLVAAVERHRDGDVEARRGSPAEGDGEGRRSDGGASWPGSGRLKALGSLFRTAGAEVGAALDEAHAALTAQQQSAGWKVVEENGGGLMPFRSTVLEKGDHRRSVGVVTAGPRPMVFFFERPAEG